MKKLILVLLLTLSVNCFSQTTFTAGILGAYSFGNGKGTFKEGLITQTNYTIDKFTTSAVAIGLTDSVATGYIGTGISYRFVVNDDADVFVGADALKGEKKNAIGGLGLSYRQGRNLAGLHLQKDFVNGENWVSLTFQTFLFDTK